MVSKGASKPQVAPYVKVGPGICSPFFDERTGLLQALDSQTGDVLVVQDDRTVSKASNTGGSPTGATLSKEGMLYIADQAHGAVVTVDQGGEPHVVVRVYEDMAFHGPHSCCVDGSSNLFFTDPGPLGETGLHNPAGSVYCISKQVLKPLALKTLAYPGGIACSQDGRVVYVAEQAANRVLRFVQRPNGVWYHSVWHQFSGRFGPSCLELDEEGETIYVGHSDFADLQSGPGLVSVLGAGGLLQMEIEVPGPEVTGLCLSKDGHTLYVAEAATQTMYRCAV
ncbi:unnamed protein product [Chrysoparadoxa australica]